MRYEVFIERSRDPSPAAVRELAVAVATRFGVPSEAIASRLVQGRFRVKGGVDLDKARRFAALLESLGAECSIVDETGQPVREPALVDDGLLTLADPAPAPPPVAPPVAASPSGDGLRLSAIDGSDADAGKDAARAAVAASKLDAFLPPEMQGEEAIDLMTPPPEMIEPAPAPVPAPMSAPVSPTSAASVPAEGLDSDAPPARERRQPLVALARDERLRIAVGAALAVLLGFTAAHLVASSSEQGFAEIRAEVRDAHAAADNEESWNALDGIRAGALDRMSSKQTHVAITAMTLWAAVGALFTFVWHRKIDWSRWRGQ